ncbi:hypothetical protein HQ602_04430 [Rhodococcus kroppenstedtii]|uniref:hypothetical protein n=1 Tax=Rhodococcoides kroppenstedtii TaxID=293050 RepID=UPI001C9A97E5|nr:hypothetical protein [Rhodococcus kroppenstedtii]MBY6435624.1 hypothetical protein [Rhodococcus kroppenstedtii]
MRSTVVAGLVSRPRSGHGDASSSGAAGGVDRVLSGPLPVRHRVLVVDLAAPSPFASAPARSSDRSDPARRVLRDLADAIGRYRPGSVVAWHPADSAAATLVLASAGDGAADQAPPPGSLLRTRRSGVDEVASGRSARPLSTADVAAAVARLSSMRQTVVVCSRPDDAWFDVLAGDADAVVVPVVDDETVSRAIALTDLLDAGRLTVVRPAGARGRTTEVRRRLGEAGIRTVLDVTESVEGLDGGEGLPGIAAGEADSADADWSRAAAVILRPRPAGRGHASAEPVLSFESTTATLRARSHGERGRVGHGLGRSIGGARNGRRRRSVAALLATAAVVLVVGLGASVALFASGGGGNSAPESARTDAASASAAEVVLDGPGVIARFDDLYYRDRDAAAAAALWDLPAGVDRAAMVADLQSSIDAVQPGTTHRLDIRPTSAPDVYDAVLTLITPDGRQFDFDQQFVVRGGDRGFTIVRKIECSAACSAPTETDTETGR